MISENILKHMYAVAFRMKELAKEHKEFEVEPNEAFTLGLLHDIGYEFTNNIRDHASAGGSILKNQNYKYWQEVNWHGINQSIYISPQLQLLNYVDMTTSSTGEYVSIEDRLQDIIRRYGKNSPQHLTALSIADIIIKYSIIKQLGLYE